MASRVSDSINSMSCIPSGGVAELNTSGESESRTCGGRRHVPWGLPNSSIPVVAAMSYGTVHYSVTRTQKFPVMPISPHAKTTTNISNMQPNSLSFDNINLTSVKFPIANYNIQNKTFLELSEDSLSSDPINDHGIPNDSVLDRCSLVDNALGSITQENANQADSDEKLYLDEDSSLIPDGAQTSSLIQTINLSDSRVDLGISRGFSTVERVYSDISRRYRSVTTVIRSTSSGHFDYDHLNDIECKTEPIVGLVSSPVNETFQLYSDNVNDCISVVNCQLDTVDSHVDNAVITVDNIDNSDEPNHQDDIIDVEDHHQSALIINTDNFVSPWSKCSSNNADYIEENTNTKLSKENQFPTRLSRGFSVDANNPIYLGFPQCDSLDSEVGSLNYLPLYPNFLCMICGKSEVLCLQETVDDTLIGRGKTKVSEIIVKVLNVSSNELNKRSDKICVKCLKMVHEIEELRELLHVKECEIRETYKLSTWVDKLESENSGEIDDILFDESSPNKVLPLEEYNKRDNCITHNSLSLLSDENVISSSNKHARKSKRYRCLKCHTSFSTAVARRSHMRRCSIDADYVYQDTVDVPNVASAVVKVKLKKKRPTCYSCDQCSKVFPQRRLLTAHMSSYHTNFDCYVCGRYLTTNARLLAHLFKFHGIGEEKNKSVKCNLCERSFQTKAGLLYHKNVAHKMGTKYVCDHCDKVYYYHVPYRSHMLFAHGKKKIVCETCGDMFFTVSKLNTHMNAAHRNAQSWHCSECDVKFITGTAYRQHNLVKHSDAKFPCHYCSAQFRKKSSLYSHLREHSIYTCNVCKTSFESEPSYELHMLELHKQVVNKINKKTSSIQTAINNRKKPRQKPIASKSSIIDKPVKIIPDTSDSLHRINLNDILLTNSYGSTSSMQVFNQISSDKLSGLNIADSNSKMRAFDLLNSTTTGLEISSNTDNLGMGGSVSFIDVEILNNIEISDSGTQLSVDDSQSHLPTTLNEITDLTTNLATSVPPSVSNFNGANSNIVVDLGKHDCINTAVTELDSSVVLRLDHASLDAHVNDLRPSVSELSPPVDIVSSVGLTHSVSDIEPSVHHLDSTEKSIDHSNIWAMLKSNSNDENLTNLQNLPSAGIDDLDIGDIVDGNVITGSEVISLAINVADKEVNESSIDDLDMDITG